MFILKISYRVYIVHLCTYCKSNLFISYRFLLKKRIAFLVYLSVMKNKFLLYFSFLIVFSNVVSTSHQRLTGV